ncbi:MAG: cytoplasmic protein [Deltaproteobacteria bacterium]|nr:cytoplasmic protein [Deltaproteobacteria bacterium]
MTDNNLVFKSPIKLLGDISENLTFGAVLARAGVGKTAFLVQIAIDGLLKNENVLHVSIDDSLKKVSLWYEETFKNITDISGIKWQDAEAVFEKLLPKRFIMTFKAEQFGIPIFMERLFDLTEQDIFKPNLVIIDGFSFSSDTKELEEFKKFAETKNFQIWFALLTHRSKKMPAISSEWLKIFEKAILLKPDNVVNVEMLKGIADKDKNFILAPSTMLLTKL